MWGNMQFIGRIWGNSENLSEDWRPKLLRTGNWGSVAESTANSLVGTRPNWGYFDSPPSLRSSQGRGRYFTGKLSVIRVKGKEYEWPRITRVPLFPWLEQVIYLAKETRLRRFKWEVQREAVHCCSDWDALRGHAFCPSSVLSLALWLLIHIHSTITVVPALQLEEKCYQQTCITFTAESCSIWLLLVARDAGKVLVFKIPFGRVKLRIAQ